jgi:hypothetical protein
MPHQLKTGTPETIQDLINGALALSPFGELPLGGLTLVFSNPAATTVTFPGAAGAMVTVKEAVAAINGTGGLSGVASLRTHPNSSSERRQNGQPIAPASIVLTRDAGFTIAMTGTANALLKLSTTADTVSAGLVAAAKITALSAGPVPGQLAIIISP